MSSKVKTSPAVRRELRKLGTKLKEARLRRRLPQNLVAERAGISRPTLTRIERGDTSVSVGAVALTLQALGLLDGWGDLHDPVGDQLAFEQLPKSIRSPR